MKREQRAYASPDFQALRTMLNSFLLNQEKRGRREEVKSGKGLSLFR